MEFYHDINRFWKHERRQNRIIQFRSATGTHTLSLQKIFLYQLAAPCMQENVSEKINNKTLA